MRPKTHDRIMELLRMASSWAHYLSERSVLTRKKGITAESTPFQKFVPMSKKDGASVRSLPRMSQVGWRKHAEKQSQSALQDNTKNTKERALNMQTRPINGGGKTKVTRRRRRRREGKPPIPQITHAHARLSYATTRVS